MKRVLIPFIFSLVLSVAAAAQIPQQYIWKITFVADSESTSRITVQNRCQQEHNFRISGQNVPYLDFARDSLTLAGGASENVPVLVNTKNLSRRAYQGQVTLFCVTCSRERACSQSRDILNVTLNVVTKDELANYRPSKEIGIDSPIAISAGSGSSAAASGASEAEVRKLLEDLSGRPALDAKAGSAAVSACGVPQMRAENSVSGKECDGNCAAKQKRVRELEAKVRAQTAVAEKYCLGLMQLENTTAFVEARARRAESQLERADRTGSDARVLASLRTEAENSRKDARVFRDKVIAAREIVDKAKEEAFSIMQELDDASDELRKCVNDNPGKCR